MSARSLAPSSDVYPATHATANSSTCPTHLTLELARYGVVSAFALCVDFGFLLLFAKHVHMLLAATGGFVIGGGVAYALSVRCVFHHRKIDPTAAQGSVFIALGLAGLIVNLIVIGVTLQCWSLPLILAKSSAAIASFAINFTLRKWLLFSAVETHDVQLRRPVLRPDAGKRA